MTVAPQFSCTPRYLGRLFMAASIRRRTASPPPFHSGGRLHLSLRHPVRSPSIAIIDDDGAQCSSLVDLTRSIGHCAEPLASVESSLSSSIPFLVDCVVAGVHMPGMNGLDLIRKPRERGRSASVVPVTALPGKHLNDAATSVGAPCLVRKPFEPMTRLIG